MPSIRSFSKILSFMLMALLVGLGSASGQGTLRFGGSDLPETDLDNFAPNNSSFAVGQLEKARAFVAQALEAGSEAERDRMYRLGFRALQEVLDDDFVREKVVDTNGQDAHWAGALKASENVLTELSPEGRAVYHDEYRHQSEVAYEQATQSKTPSKLRRVDRSFCAH